MKREIKLLDYNGNPTYVDVGDTDRVVINIISGDMVMIHPFRKDSSESRLRDYDDGTVTVYAKDFDKLNSLTDSYDVFDIGEGERIIYSPLELLFQCYENIY